MNKDKREQYKQILSGHMLNIQHTYGKQIREMQTEIDVLTKTIKSLPLCECHSWGRCLEFDDMTSTHHPDCKNNGRTNQRVLNIGV